LEVANELLAESPFGIPFSLTAFSTGAVLQMMAQLTAAYLTRMKLIFTPLKNTVLTNKRTNK
jgi:hypothetical protein